MSETNLKKTVLALDDVPDMLSTIRAVLKNDYNVFVFSKSAEALRFLNLKNADLILLDVEMPEKNGYEVLKDIRAIDKYKSTPVFFLTGNTGEDEAMKAKSAGACDIINKPIDIDVLQQTLKKYI